MAQQFSGDGKYFAQITSDGKLKVWNTLSSSLEQEFTPDFHLTTPCTCLHFWNPREALNKGSPSPKKKKRKEEPTLPNIILGTTSGIVLIYSIAKANVEYTVDSSTGSQVNCLSVNSNGILYSGADQNILEWNLKKKEIQSQWKAGNETVTAILALSTNLLTASKNIKLWDLDKREVLKTFTGHSTDVVTLQYVDLPNDSYLLSGSKADRMLSVWKLSSEEKHKNAVCNYLMEDAVYSVAIDVAEDGLTSVAATNRSGALHIFQHKLNGKCDKPLKPKMTIRVVSDTGQSEQVAPIRIFGARFLDSETVCLGHGSEVILTFENVQITSKRVEVLIRAEPHLSGKSKEAQVSKMKKALISEEVNYISNHTTALPGKRKGGVQAEIPMEQRLENLTLTKPEGAAPRVNNVAQLLLQGLHSKDRNILRAALCRKDEEIIRNTVKRLPIAVFETLVKELALLVHGKTIQSRFGALWLKHLAQVHSGVFVSNPNLPDLFSGVLGSIGSRINTQTALCRLKGKLELLVPQVGINKEIEGPEDDGVLIFNDKDSSDSESEEEMQIEIPSDSEPENWEEDEEDSGEEKMANGNSGSDSEGSVVLVDDDSDSD
ncbi:WD repeat-containing protein 43 [Anthonomus grandis grandis]|uniref:WD repeat-containing protein 43 n=1 Tax=Anthonomus grandis grandis TaxID=2921223 RepID=UPI002165B696|nr:WD repeat-containing protein 43 [Anthonomus grandis grandis]